MAPTEGRDARPERQWGCCRGTPDNDDDDNNEETWVYRRMDGLMADARISGENQRWNNVSMSIQGNALLTKMTFC